MRRRVPPLNWLLRSLLILVGLGASTTALAQPPFQRYATPDASSTVQASAETAISLPGGAIPAAISSLLEKGNLLESSGLWAEALSYYDDALHEHPADQFLEDRFDVARLHFNYEQRIADRSYVDSLRTVQPAQARDIYADLMSKIEAHYYTTPPWQELTRRGARSLEVALADEAFLRANGVQVPGQTVVQLRSDVVQLANRYAIRTRDHAAAVTGQVAKLCRDRIGLSETATWLEFAAGAAGGLDHYSAYLTADQLRDIYAQIEGNFVGLGVELKADNSELLIVDVIPRSPAESAGIRPGDRIIAVDGQATSILTADAAASMLTGPEGSTVRVSVVTPNQSARELAIRRAEVEVPSLEGARIVEPATGVAYVRIPAFQKTTSADLEAELWDLHRQGMRSLIIDLRGNPGGLLTASVEVADKFVADGGIVSTRGRSDEENFNYRAHRPGTWRVPLVVLIDGNSASASEIFAAAIKDSGRGTVVGERSYGKGSVQGIFTLGTSGAGARITTARFFSPNGNPISNVGVSPDVDTRRATAVATGDGSSPTAAGPHEVAFRGALNSQPSAMASVAPVAGSPPTAAATAEAPESPKRDEALDMAIEIAQKLPIAQL